VAISGATGSKLALGYSQGGKRITVEVTGFKVGYVAVAKTSAAVSVPVGPIVGSQPSIRGTRTVGRTLTAVPGSWKPSGVAFTYQWYANDKAISGATKSTLKLTSSLRGKYISVKVTGHKSGYAAVSKTSPKTARIR